MDDIRILQHHIVQLSKEMQNDQITLHREDVYLCSHLQLCNKRIDNLVTMTQQQQNDTSNLLINRAFDWQVQINAIYERTQLLFKSTQTITQIQSQLYNLPAAVETLRTCTLTSYIIMHTTLVRSVSVTLFILRVQANKWHFLNQEVILSITGYTNTVENNFVLNNCPAMTWPLYI